MAKLERTRDERGILTCQVTMSTNEHKQLMAFALPAIEKAIKKIQKKLEKYEDRHDIGEATARDEDMRLKYQDMIDELEGLGKLV